MKALVIASLLAASLGARLPVRFAKAADTALCSGGSLSYETYYLSPGATTVKDCTLNGVEFYFPVRGSTAGRSALRVEGGTSNGGIEIDVRAGAPVDIAIRGVHFVDSTLEIQGMTLPAGSSITVRDCTYDLNGYWEANELYFDTVLNSKITFANNVLNTNFENGYTIALYTDGYNSGATFIDSEVVFEKNRVEANVTTGSVARGLYMEDVYGSGLAVNFRDNAIASGASSSYYYSWGLHLYRDNYCSDCLEGKITVKATGNTFDGVQGYLGVYDGSGNTDVAFRDNQVTCNPGTYSFGEIEVEHYYGAAITDPLRIDVGNNVFDNCPYGDFDIDAPVLPDGSALTVTGNLFTPKADYGYEAVFFSSETIDFTSKSIITISNNELRTDVVGYTSKMFGFYLNDAPLSAEDRAYYGSIGMCSNKYLGTVYPIENLTDYVYLEDDSEAFFSSQCLTMHYSAAPAGRAALTVAAATVAAMAAAFVAAVV